MRRRGSASQPRRQAVCRSSLESSVEGSKRLQKTSLHQLEDHKTCRPQLLGQCFPKDAVAVCSLTVLQAFVFQLVFSSRGNSKSQCCGEERFS